VSKRKKDAIWLVVLSIACGLLIWHAVYWYSTEFYLEMFQWLPTGRGYLTVLYNLGLMLEWLPTGRGYLTVLYNLGLMLVLGVLLGFMMIKITDLMGYEIDEAGQVDDKKGRR